MANDSANSAWQGTIQDIGRRLDTCTFVVIDLETTGGAPHLGAAITEIGAVKVRTGVVIAEFNSFVDPRHPIPGYITDLTGITDEMVFQSPTTAEIFPTLLEFLGSPEETVIVAQNAPFRSLIPYSRSSYPWIPLAGIPSARYGDYRSQSLNT
jgi:DNA polymerase III epsilon subunit-like protein